LAGTGAALVISGVPAVYYPHVPPEMTRPLVELFIPLITYGFAPYTALNEMDIWGTLSMAPLAAWWLVAMVWVWSAEPTWKHFLAAPLMIAVLLPHLVVPDDAPKTTSFVARITRKWDPINRDKPALLARKLIEKGG